MALETASVSSYLCSKTVISPPSHSAEIDLVRVPGVCSLLNFGDSHAQSNNGSDFSRKRMAINARVSADKLLLLSASTSAPFLPSL